MEKLTRRRYTLEYKQEAVRLVSSGQKVAAAKALGIVEQNMALPREAIDRAEHAQPAPRRSNIVGKIDGPLLARCRQHRPWLYYPHQSLPPVALHAQAHLTVHTLHSLVVDHDRIAPQQNM